MPRKRNSSLSASEDMISLQRYPKKYAVTLDKQDYNARVLAKYWLGSPDRRIPHSRRRASNAEFERVKSLVKGTPIWFAYEPRTPSSRSPSRMQRAELLERMERLSRERDRLRAQLASLGL